MALALADEMAAADAVAMDMATLRRSWGKTGKETSSAALADTDGGTDLIE